MRGEPSATEQRTSVPDLAERTYLEGNEETKIGLTLLSYERISRTGLPFGKLVVCIIQVSTSRIVSLATPF
jgi:hypothetical protein